ncbi:hypothetical protein C0995_003517, partial [Termitomyces sp. Mi166
MKGIHPIFHVQLLEHHNPNTFPSQYHDPPPPIEVDGEDHYKVEKILNSYMYWSKVRYLVWWL